MPIERKFATYIDMNLKLKLTMIARLKSKEGSGERWRTSESVGGRLP